MEAIVYKGCSVILCMSKIHGVERVRLTHWGWDNMADIFLTIFSNAFPWMRIFEWLKFVPKGPVDNNTVLVQNRRQAISWNSDGLGWWRIYVSLGINELRIERIKRCWLGFLHCQIINYWCIDRINGSLPTTTKDFNHPHHLNVEKGLKIQM